jgi:hypothetical protein
MVERQITTKKRRTTDNTMTNKETLYGPKHPTQNNEDWETRTLLKT